MIKYKWGRGFTLIELMIVLAVVGILAAIAIPSYQNYVIRAKISEGLELASRVKSAVWDNAVVGVDPLPSTNAAAGLPLPDQMSGEWVSSIALGDVPVPGSITITYNMPELASDNTIIFFPENIGGALKWHCNLGLLSVKFRPERCRN